MSYMMYIHVTKLYHDYDTFIITPTCVHYIVVRYLDKQ